jgi:hypothetical protein
MRVLEIRVPFLRWVPGKLPPKRDLDLENAEIIFADTPRLLHAKFGKRRLTKMDTWKECAWFKCRIRFEPSRRANQRRGAGGQHHDGALYCSRSCQQKAYRLRRDAAAKDGAATVTKQRRGTYPHATVTRPQQHIENIEVFSTKNDHARPSNVVPSDWKPWPPSVWRPIV